MYDLVTHAYGKDADGNEEEEYIDRLLAKVAEQQYIDLGNHVMESGFPDRPGSNCSERSSKADLGVSNARSCEKDRSRLTL